ncbi:hypothetical protein TRFO_36397 [Tritrichomonas foetus]|uniref:Condensin complex subunit 1 C-terminal domain-containing protein n=1 Tax=Tritrichomonas foetus TaxID=1144522 RepID=A0A1J4JGG1_9EUKA|nr:hypothetical protein TRFO_36397 [Tritrichomonas foetus]|eukprot:OHS97391.1 hypothetical protein TRFO_36397 [Tritrichomonas foetus]
MENDAEEVVSIVDSFGLMNIDEEKISSIKRGDFSSLDEEFSDLLIVDNNSEQKLHSLEDILMKYVNKEDESEFWSCLREKELSPLLLEVLCFLLLEKESSIYNHGVIIYSILLSMEPSSRIWNPTIFKPILSSLISTQQILETGAQLSPQIKAQIELSQILLSNLTNWVNEAFMNMIGFEVLLAINEIVTKLIVGFRPEFDKYNEILSNLAIKFLTKIASTQLEYLLPFIIQILLLQFASNTTSFSNRLEKLRDKISDFVMKIIKPEDPLLVLLCKHMMLRAPEKSHLRKAVAQIIYRFSKFSTNIKDIINFALKAARSSRIGLRSFTSYLIQLYLVNIAELESKLGSDSTELAIELSTSLKKHLTDQAPTVRAMALDGIAQIFEGIDSNPFGAVIQNVIDNSKYIEQILRKRIVDEKLIVRRAALNCLNQIAFSSNFNLSQAIIEMITSRTRDRAVSIRTQAIKSVNSALVRFPKSTELHEAWLNSVLPLIVDPENTVQNEALDSITNHFFNPLINGETEIFTRIMSPYHFDFMKNVFTLYKHKAISLLKICKALFKRLTENSDSLPFWKLVELLSTVESSHLKPKDFTKLWKNKNNLPPEYFLILAHLGIKKPKIRNDSIKILDNELKQNTKRFALMHSIIQVLHIQDDCESLWANLIHSCCTYINECAQHDNTDENDVYGLITTIYTLGELITTSNPKILFDYNYIGLQLLISEKLPNNTKIPSQIRALAAISLGKLCIVRKDVSTTFVSAFAHLLTSKADPAIKCNSLVVLCDLCVRYSALVDPHVQIMTNCFADPSPVVRHQTLHVVTRLIVEDFLKMRPLLFFKYVFAITDADQGAAAFARCCLFNVILSKINDLLTSFFIDSIYYFSGEVQLPTLLESSEESETFKITDKERRQLAISLMVSKMNEMSAFNMVQSICNNVLNKFIKNEFNVFDHKNILDDSIFALIELEDKMKQAIESEVLNEDAVTEKFVEATKKMINDIHNSMIQNVLPTLNNMHKMLRDLHSPLQVQLKKFYQRICAKNPNLITQLEKTEPLLAAELMHEMKAEELDEETATPVNTPKNPQPFASPLLSNIASTPRSLLLSPASKSPGSLLQTPKKNKSVMEFSTPPHDSCIA